MALPDVTLSVADGALGSLPPNTSNIHVKLGVSTTGTVNTLYQLSSVDTVKSVLTSGPLAEVAAYHLTIAGGPVLCMPINASVAGASTAVTQVGTGPAVTLTGAPNDEYIAVVTVVTGGAVGTATFTYSVDSGNTVSAVITTASTYLIPGTGVTLNFAAGTYVAATTYSFSTTPPGFSSTDITNAMTALFGYSQSWGILHLVGASSGSTDSANATASAGIFAVLATQMAGAFTNYRYARAVMEAPDQVLLGQQTTVTDGLLSAAFAASGDTRVGVAAGYVDLTSVLTGRQVRRAAAWPITARLGARSIVTDPGRYSDGNLPGIVRVWRDERKQPGLDAARFMTIRTHIGTVGYFASDGVMMAPTGSDYAYIANGRVMDLICAVARPAMLHYLNDSVRVNPDGTINDKDARAIEQYISAAIKAAVLQPGYISPPTGSTPLVQVNRTNNVLSTAQLLVKIRATPLGYLRAITADLGFNNVSLALS